MGPGPRTARLQTCHLIRDEPCRWASVPGTHSVEELTGWEPVRQDAVKTGVGRAGPRIRLLTLFRDCLHGGTRGHTLTHVPGLPGLAQAQGAHASRHRTGGCEQRWWTGVGQRDSQAAPPGPSCQLLGLGSVTGVAGLGSSTIMTLPPAYNSTACPCGLTPASCLTGPGFKSHLCSQSNFARRQQQQ